MIRSRGSGAYLIFSQTTQHRRVYIVDEAGNAVEAPPDSVKGKSD